MYPNGMPVEVQVLQDRDVVLTELFQEEWLALNWARAYPAPSERAGLARQSVRRKLRRLGGYRNSATAATHRSKATTDASVTSCHNGGAWSTTLESSSSSMRNR